ncbi:MAG: polyamine aminopropyltransferase [Gammaproteobacteria bacterium]|nr:polyamine aminopropyltransferase [Gammaproteobacteria bacterium]
MSMHLPDPVYLTRKKLLLHDTFLLSIMAILAACGLIYEYLLSHYAGRILGAVETAIYTMIGLMIVSMGLGSFAARVVRDVFTAFAWLEGIIATIGITCILMIGGLVALTTLLPQIIADTFLLPPDLLPAGGILLDLRRLALVSPYLFGFVLGFLIGMEIPLIARIRESLHGEHLVHNTGTIYGIDYIGAGVGAVIWVSVMLSMDITRAAVWTALANLFAGLIFLWRYWQRIKFPVGLLMLHALLLLLAIAIEKKGEAWSASMTNMLYRDEVVFDRNTNYQHLTVTRRLVANRQQSILGFYINGRLQFSSNDEHIYHSMLVYPAMAVAEYKKKILIVGGGDGLALRDVLRWNPQEVRLIDLDKAVIDFFSGRQAASTDNRISEIEGDRASLPAFQQALLALNGHAFADPRVTVQYGDAFIEIDTLLGNGEIYDVIIVDLPDPSHPDLNRLYTVNFYARLNQLLAGGGAMSVQSTSPYHARKAFLSIGSTIKAAGFNHVEQYRENIPSFGEWGWTIATKQGKSARQRIAELPELPVDDGWTSLGLLRAAFEFPAGFHDGISGVKINTLGSQRIYQYHHQAWQQQQGVYLRPLPAGETD